MRLHFVVLCLLLTSALAGFAERNHLQPAAFKPLTSLPWKTPGATLETVLDCIFREPNESIRYPILVAYLNIIPPEKLGEAFDRCIVLEGTQCPTALVELFLGEWAERDPQACWRKTQELFDLTGFEQNWMDYDSWPRTFHVPAAQLPALEASPFYLDSDALQNFPIGIEASSLPADERVKILKDFSERWFRYFDSWPGYYRPIDYKSTPQEYPARLYELIEIFSLPVDRVPSYIDRPSFYDCSVAQEMALRRWLEAEPSSALTIIKKAYLLAQDQIQKADLLASLKRPTPIQPRASFPSEELLTLWAGLDLTGMMRAADLPELDTRLRLSIRAALMSRATPEIRQRWLAETAESFSPFETSLWVGWARSDPKTALEAAFAKNDFTIIARTVHAVVYGRIPYNASHFGLGVFRDLDVKSLPTALQKEHFAGWEDQLEQWGDIDIGETAQYGVHFLLQTHYVPREQLLRFFSGEDLFSDEKGMVNRTFCALRRWAVFKPQEMKTWIASLPEEDLRKALTWLQEHPWGNDPKKTSTTTPEAPPPK